MIDERIRDAIERRERRPLVEEVEHPGGRACFGDNPPPGGPQFREYPVDIPSG